ncbi:metal ABC transporter permease [Salisediminibacterium beveridgei]|uniref:Zinc ABC transporter, inner membrane permease protein ZnuB n=1 Tax=Salisediminibacterium beveridgei TaxID=632773 RepID=A0A1D7QUE2_9BACI|nr:metal ABC transporter permease [Salisediminibacterium beveridgei]AOM82617.1 Zinc ABC transporter, inner membrane permease protein ZnuB [Salisediminibacterium beveridgei]
MMEVLEQLTFLERGIIAGLVVGILAPMMGAFLLVRRMTIISEGLSQITLAGIATGVVIGQSGIFMQDVNPLITGFLFALAGALIVEKLRSVYRYFQELAVPIILSAGLGISAVLISMSGMSSTEWFNFLFGSLLTVSISDLIFILSAGTVSFLILIILYKEWLSISFDSEFAHTSGIAVKWMNLLFAVLVAAVISVSISVVGILLVGAMITLPVAAALQVSHSFRQVILFGIMFGESAVILGMLSSYYLNIATGGMIVTAGILILLMAIMIKNLRYRILKTSFEKA